MLRLGNLKPAVGSVKKKKRVGRGNASGHGTYSGRGLKGQKSRSGSSGLKRLGMKSSLLQIPKVRGFKSDKPKNQIVNLSELNNNFKAGEEINAKSLLGKNLIESVVLPVKILGKGDLQVKDLSFSSDLKISASAKEKISKQAGKIK